jgi:hypothetical protein
MGKRRRLSVSVSLPPTPGSNLIELPGVGTMIYFVLPATA